MNENTYQQLPGPADIRSPRRPAYNRAPRYERTWSPQTILLGLYGALAMAFHLVLGRPLRRWRTRWGATHEEVARTLPGDELVPDPSWSYTLAVSIQAPPEAVWPWIVQIGKDRGGFYSFQLLENLAGCQIANVQEIVPEHQHLAPGDCLYLHPKVPAPVAAVEEGRLLALGEREAQGPNRQSWVFVLEPQADGTTRLLSRGRHAHGPRLVDRIAMGPTLLDPISFVMHRRMLQSIRRLAERHASPTR